MTTITLYQSPESGAVVGIYEDGESRAYRQVSPASVERLSFLVYDYAAAGSVMRPFLSDGLVGWTAIVKRAAVGGRE